MKFFRKLRAFFRKDKLDAEMAEEMRLHVELQTERNIAAGMNSEEARHAALREFGNLAGIQERARETRSLAWVEAAWKDARFALRSLGRAPGFALTAIVILALGVGASTTIYSVVHALLLSPLQYRAPSELVAIRSAHPRSASTDLAPGTFADLADTQSFSAVAAHYYYYVNLTGTAAPLLLNSAEVTRDYFLLFGVAPQLGRLWDVAGPDPGATPVVVLSYEIWRSQFHGRESIIGEQIVLDEVPHTVIAVMPRSFKEPAETVRFWRPMRPGADNRAARDWRYWTVFGRLAPGQTLESANAELATLAKRQAMADPGNYAGWTLQVFDLHDLVVRNHRSGLLLVLGGVGCLMAITIANFAGLALVRTAARAGELAIRHALGASRLQVGRLLLAEAVWLGLLGGGGGLLVAWWGIGALLRWLPEGWLPRADEIGFSLPVIGVGVALAFLAGSAAGLFPVCMAASHRAGEAMKAAQRTIAGASSRRIRMALVVMEIAFTLVLLSGAGLLGRSLDGLVHRRSGVDADRVLTATISLNAKRYDSPEKSWNYFTQAEHAVALIPGVDSVGLTQTSPFRWGIPVSFRPEASRDAGGTIELPAAFTDSVSVDYFRTVGISLQRGRLFGPTDDHRHPLVVILSQAAARRYFGDEDPIGRFLTAGPGSRFEVVGVVSDVRRAGLAAEVPLQVYRPLAQRTPSFATLMVRTTLAPASLTPHIRVALAGLDPDIPVTEIATLDELVGRSIAQPRLHTAIFALFAVAAVLLAAVGIYGLIAYGVAQRTREFAVRTALGAQEGEVFRLVLREGSRLTVWGIGLGLMGSAAMAPLLQHLIYDIAPLDPVVFLAGPCCILAVGLASCIVPARRAAKVDPMVALRAE